MPLVLVLAHPARAERPATLRPEISVCFTPGSDCAALIVEAVRSARTTVRVQAYEFTSRPIVAALLDARARGVDVELILDRRAAFDGYSAAADVAAAGIPIWVDDPPGIAHNKIIVIDERLVVGGSYNFTHAAETRNVENVTFIADTAIAQRFLANWEARRAVSYVYGPQNYVSGRLSRRRHAQR